jgi:hypothetical protein
VGKKQLADLQSQLSQLQASSDQALSKSKAQSSYFKNFMDTISNIGKHKGSLSEEKKADGI